MELATLKFQIALSAMNMNLVTLIFELVLYVYQKCTNFMVQNEVQEEETRMICKTHHLCDLTVHPPLTTTKGKLKSPFR